MFTIEKRKGNYYSRPGITPLNQPLITETKSATNLIPTYRK